MTWFAVELLREDEGPTFNAEAFIGKARLEEDQTITFLFDSVPPRGAQVRLLALPELSDDYWADCPPEIDFGNDAMREAAGDYRRMRGGRR